MDHKGADGTPCTQHAAPSETAILALATVGSRAPGFSHDIASKLQSLVMALEEIGDRAEALEDSDLTIALAAARTSVSELTGQLHQFRALCRRIPPSPTPVRLIFERAAERAAVRVHGEPPPLQVLVSAPEVIHATALLLEGAAGERSPREAVVTFDPKGFRLPAGASSEALAVAAHVFARNGGELRCTPDQLVITW